MEERKIAPHMAIAHMRLKTQTRIVLDLAHASLGISIIHYHLICYLLTKERRVNEEVLEKPFQAKSLCSSNAVSCDASPSQADKTINLINLGQTQSLSALSACFVSAHVSIRKSTKNTENLLFATGMTHASTIPLKTL